MTTPAAAFPARFRHATADSTRGGEDLAVTLQARLRVIALVIGGTMLAFFVLLSVRLLSDDGSMGSSMRLGRLSSGVAIPLSVAAAWWLRRDRLRAMAALRLVEIVLITGFSGLLAFGMVADFPSFAPILDKAPLDLGLSQAGWMSLIIVAYGVLIPNQWQRTTLILALILSSVVAVDAWNLSQHDIAAPVAATYLGAQWTLLLGSRSLARIALKSRRRWRAMP